MVLSVFSCCQSPISIPRIRVSLEEDLDIRYGLHEALQAGVGIGEERTTRDDQHPLGVPDRPADQARILRGLTLKETADVVVGAERGEAADVTKRATQGVVGRNPRRVPPSSAVCLPARLGVLVLNPAHPQAKKVEGGTRT